MFTRRILIIALALLLIVSLSGCFVFGGSGMTLGNGTMIDGAFTHEGSITKIVISNIGATINLTPESSGELTYTIDENLEDLLEITHRNGVLQIGTRNNRSISSNQGIRFYISTDALEEILVDGAAAIRGQGTFTAETFALEINGAGNADLALDAQNVSVELNGAASVTLSGTAEHFRAGLAGAGSISARSLLAQHANVSLEGVGTIQVHAELSLDASAEGVGSITYWGNPELTSFAEGLATIRRGD